MFEVTIPDSCSSMPGNCESDYLVHPATLDTVLQSMLVAIPKADDVPNQVWIPTTINTIHISNDVVRNHGQVLHGLCESSSSGFREMVGSIMTGNETFDSLSGITMHGVVFTGLGSTQTLPQDSRYPDQSRSMLCAEPSWKPDLDFLETGNTRAILGGDNVEAPEGLVRFCRQADKVVKILCRRTLRTLDPNTYALLPTHLQKYIEWMRKRCGSLQNGEILPTSRSNIQFHQSDQDEDSTIKGFTADYPFDGRFVCHVFDSLGQIFKETTTPLAVLMTEDNLTRFYREAYGCSSITQIFRKWFDLKGHKNPDMRVIEIGAGTASITVPVVAQLGAQNGRTPCFSHWTFTDLSIGWFENAKVLLHDWEPRIEYRRLDIEEDPVGQGFDEKSYDVVLAVNVGFSILALPYSPLP